MNPSGKIPPGQTIGPEHPDYMALMAQQRASPPQLVKVRLFGILLFLGGIGLEWLLWHEAVREGQYSIKLTFLAPLCFFGGIFFLWHPEWSGPWRTDSPKAQKIATFVLIGVSALACAANQYALNHYRP